MLHRAGGKGWEIFLFTDEKLFTVEQAHNRQNDRIWSSDAPGPSSVVEHRQKSKSVMVMGGVCATGKTPLVFVEKGVMINKDVYVRDILEAVVLPWTQQNVINQEWTFQQDSAPAHRAKKTQESSGAKRIFLASSQPLDGRPTHRISTLWTTVSGQFLRPGCVRSLTKVSSC